jgi:hypothetical protein
VLPTRRRLRRRVRDLLPRVLVVVTVEAQQFPVAPVGGIMVVIVVFMMDRQFTQRFAAEFAAAPGTDPGLHFERLSPIGLLLLCLVASRLGNQPVLAAEIYSCLL